MTTAQRARKYRSALRKVDEARALLAEIPAEIDLSKIAERAELRALSYALSDLENAAGSLHSLNITTFSSKAS